MHFARPGFAAEKVVHHGKRFTEKNKAELFERGFTVVEDAIENPDYYIDKAHKWAEGLGTGIECKNPETWTSEKWPFNIHGIIKHGDVAHTDWMWEIRKEVKPIFEEIYNTKNLVTSFDGISFDPPQEDTKMLQDIEGRTHMHVDQSGRNKGLHSIQGMVTLFDIEKNDSTLRVVPGSHKLHTKLVSKLLDGASEKEKNKQLASGWHQYPKETLSPFLEEFNLFIERVTQKKGSIVLWDSRLIHGKGGPLLPRAEKKWRITAYVCMTPKSWCSSSMLKKRIKAFNELRMTNHLPHSVKMNPKKPRTYGNEKLNKKWESFNWSTEKPKMDTIITGLVGF
jgi:hypothetical protein